ncbi:Solute carrier family 50 (Sugar transporter) [Heracleum sosnowskyi]|uniref:Solute carrier family 50 (Sugar transporter) n=1 Tax=Heracleum sosnowskyi TaxID=360622 RepID=A0AAD8HBR0_9APIA|nr:Solute carrier family 50 (Sugar transporter) [Heracleum sosnowskyi]
MNIGGEAHREEGDQMRTHTTSNFVSFLVYLAPIPTFHRIVKKKSSEVSLKLFIYPSILILAYAPKKALVFTLKLVMLLNFAAFWVIVVVVHFLVKPPKQVQVLGGLNLLLSLSVFIAPLSIMKKRCYVVFYGFLSRDIYVATPNILGFLYGIVQTVLYAIYRNCDNKVTEELKLPEITKPTTESSPEIHPSDSVLKSEADNQKGSGTTKEENVNEKELEKNKDASDQV